MSKLNVPIGYKSALSLYDTQNAIEESKSIFKYDLINTLNIKRIELL